MNREVDDKGVWMVMKVDKFSVKTFYDGMVQRGLESFSEIVI